MRVTLVPLTDGAEGSLAELEEKRAKNRTMGSLKLQANLI